MNYIGQLQRKQNTRNADLVGEALAFRSDGDAAGQRPKTRDRFLQWRSRGLPGVGNLPTRRVKMRKNMRKV